ncbi:MAG: hypothetical protein JWP97_6693 [Labilithrix sp.]|nr:hypothetical protein [Labilithrix sp.]
MDRWIATAWKAFWVGLGASAVLISQSVLAPAPAPSPEAPAPQAIPYVPAAQPAAFAPTRASSPVLSRLPPRCATVADVKRCS